ncbi:MAG: zinc-binding metallopeptidase family protein [Chromatiales bacterium]
MKAFFCECGWRVFFENTECLRCKRLLGFDPARTTMVALDPAEGPTFSDAELPRRTYRLCRNYQVRCVCNWLVRAQDPRQYCLACNLNQQMPNLEEPQHQLWWAQMEAAKRRLLYTLLALELPIVSKLENPETGLAFAFLQDKRHNPNAVHDFVTTGHSNGLITVNMMEADDAARESTRLEMNEPYRTLLGHFRHESGHYYWERVVKDTGRLETFRTVFGDERADYQQALHSHYAQRGQTSGHADYISAYARSHPWEDWAETWAHYLHIFDALETAQVFGMAHVKLDQDDFQACLAEWSTLTIMLNELNRSVGQYDAYPFVLSERIAAKLAFVHESVATLKRPKRPAAGGSGAPRNSVPSV